MFALMSAYLIGSIPVAWIVTRLAIGKDIRHLGSGNVGVMNSALQAGRLAGLLVLLSEAAKGIGAVLLARAFELGPLMTGLTVAAAVFGTQRMVWLGGRGGRGNTCGGAALMVISPVSLAAGIVVWTVARWVTGSSFRATRIALAVWPFLFGILTGSWILAASVALICLLYLQVQKPETDDHLHVKQRGASAWSFLLRGNAGLGKGAGAA